MYINLKALIHYNNDYGRNSGNPAYYMQQRKQVKRRKPRTPNYAKITVALLALTLIILLITALISKLSSKGDESGSLLSTNSEKNTSTHSLSESNDNASSTESSISNDEESEEVSLPEYSYSIDITPYLDYIEPDRSGDKNDYWLILVNKEKSVAQNYIPPNLVKSQNTKKGYENTEINATADKALEALIKEAAANGFTKIRMSSGYRSYALQDWWFKYYKDKYRQNYKTESELEEYVYTFSMKPGHSEHQTGLAVDIYDTDTNSEFTGTPGSFWLAENAHKFGFILRYPEGKEDVTKIMYESWHFRFVGRSVATVIYEKGWTLEEYHRYSE